jgi:hypothetical protein
LAVFAVQGRLVTSSGRRRKETERTYVALAADGLVAVVLGGKGLEGRLNDTTTETEDKVKGGLLNEAKSHISHKFNISHTIDHNTK